MYHDPEILAMNEVYEAFKELDKDQIKRIIDWLTSKFGLTEVVIPEIIPPAPVSTSYVESPVKTVEQAAAPEPPTPATAPEPAQGQSPVHATDTTAVETAEELAPQQVPVPNAAEFAPSDSTKNLGIKRYKTIENLFLAADFNTVAHKILLTASYLQEKLNYEEFGSYDINSRLKKMGYGIQNVTNAINSLMKKKPALIIQTKKEGASKQAKRKFRVTPEGIKIALSCLKKSK